VRALIERAAELDRAGRSKALNGARVALKRALAAAAFDGELDRLAARVACITDLHAKAQARGELARIGAGVSVPAYKTRAIVLAESALRALVEEIEEGDRISHEAQDGSREPSPEVRMSGECDATGVEVVGQCKLDGSAVSPGPGCGRGQPQRSGIPAAGHSHARHVPQDKGLGLAPVGGLFNEGLQGV